MWSLQIGKKKIKYFVPNILKLYFTMCDLCFHEFILLLILKFEESNSHVIKKTITENKL